MNKDRKKTILLGVLIGAVIGAAFAWFVSEEIDYEDEEAVHGVAKLGATDYFSLGMSLLTLARQFGDMIR